MVKAAKTFVYHFFTSGVVREKKAQPIATIALIQDDTGLWHRGIAVCSPKDTFDYTKGRNKAIGFATKAMVKDCNTLPFEIKMHNWEVPLHAMIFPTLFKSALSGLIFRSSWDVELTPYEQELVMDKDEKLRMKAQYPSYATVSQSSVQAVRTVVQV
jgi:hypothetical protein